MNDLTAVLFDRWMLLTAAGVFALFRALGQVPFLASNRWYKRLLPMLPECVGAAAVLAGSVPTIAAHPWPLRALAGVWVAYLAKSFRKILGQTVLGDDKVIAAKAVLDDDEQDTDPGEVA